MYEPPPSIPLVYATSGPPVTESDDLLGTRPLTADEIESLPVLASVPEGTEQGAQGSGLPTLLSWDGQEVIHSDANPQAPAPPVSGRAAPRKARPRPPRQVCLCPVRALVITRAVVTISYIPCTIL